MGVKVIFQNLNYCDIEVWITGTALVTCIHSHPRGDIDRFNYCIRIAHNVKKPDVPFASTKMFYLSLQGDLTSDLALTIIH